MDCARSINLLYNSRSNKYYIFVSMLCMYESNIKIIKYVLSKVPVKVLIFGKTLTTYPDEIIQTSSVPDIIGQVLNHEEDQLILCLSDPLRIGETEVYTILTEMCENIRTAYWKEKSYLGLDSLDKCLNNSTKAMLSE